MSPCIYALITCVQSAPPNLTMSRNVSTGSTKARPSAIQPAKSFTRYEPSKTSPSLGRNRASTIQPGTPPSRLEATAGYPTSPTSPERSTRTRAEDVFEKLPSPEDGSLSPDTDRALSRSQSLPERFDELPIELISLTDR